MAVIAFVYLHYLSLVDLVPWKVLLLVNFILQTLPSVKSN